MTINAYIRKRIREDKKFAKEYADKGNEFALDVASLITEARLHFGLTQEALAKKIGTKQSSIARIERGSALPSLSFLQKIAKALGTPLIAPKFGFMGLEKKRDLEMTDTVSFGDKPVLSPLGTVQDIDSYRKQMSSVSLEMGETIVG